MIGLFLLVAAPVASIALTADPVPVVAVDLKRTRLQARVSLGFDRALLLNPEPAAAGGLKPFPLIGKFRVKNPQLPGGEALIRGNLAQADVAGTGRQRLPTVWIDKPITGPPGTGIVSIMALRADRVVVHQPAAPSGGQRYILPRSGADDADMRWSIGGETIRASMDLSYDYTVLSARAARALEAEGMVRRIGRVSLWSPIPGMRLPVEHLAPAAGAAAMGLPLADPVVRITRAQAEALDARAAERIAGMEADDDDAIVVTAEREGRQGRQRAWMLIGRDMLRHCSQIALDRPGQRWELTCAFPR